MKKALIIAALLGHWVYMGTRPAPPVRLPPQNKTIVSPIEHINEAKGQLQEGDIVVRMHTDPASQFIKNFNRKDKKYSHAGIVFYDNGHPYVYHIVNGSENPGEKLKKDSPDQFCDPRKTLSFGIFRYTLSAKETENMKLLIQKWYSKGISFDHRFDLATDQKMYCSEMVSKALSKATANRIHIPATKPTKLELAIFAAYSKLPFDQVKKMNVIAIDELYGQTGCTSVKEYSY